MDKLNTLIICIFVLLTRFIDIILNYLTMRPIVTVLVVLIFSSTSCKFIKEKGWFNRNKADTMAVWQARQDSIRVADSIRVEIEMMKAIEQARIDSVRADEEARMERETRFKYNIIVGSFLTPEYAEDYLKYYLQMGYRETQIIMDRKGRFNLVSAEAYDNISRAISRLYNFQDTVEFEAWLYIKD